MTAANQALSYSAASGCAATNSNPCKTGETVSFSTSPFGYNTNCATHSYIWRFGDGASATTQSASHQYTTAGTYSASLTISNPTQQFTLPFTITVTGTQSGCGSLSTSTVAPTFSAPSGCSSSNAASKCAANETISFNVGTSGYSFSCATHTFQWNFGDGTSGTGINPTHKYAAGNYTASVAISSPTQTVTVTVPVSVNSGGGSTGPCGEMTPLKLFIVYANASGTCNQASPNSSCQSNELLNFSVDVFNYALSCAPHTITWDFGDGGSATGRAVTHTFSRSDAYTVRATVNNGTTSIVLTSPINVGGSGGNGGTPTVVVGFTATAMTGVPFGYIFTPTVDVANVVTKWIWDFGDGSTSTVTGATPSAQSHIYASSGPHHVTLTAQNANGAQVGQSNQTIGQATSVRRRAAH